MSNVLIFNRLRHSISYDEVKLQFQARPEEALPADNGGKLFICM